MSKEIKILTPRIYEHSDFFHNAVDFAREHSLNTNEFCLELSHYLVDNFDKVWKIEKPRVYKKLADLEAKLAESEKKNRELHTAINMSIPNQIVMKDEIERLHTCIDDRIAELVKENEQLKQQLAEKENTISNLIEDSKASKELLKKENNELVFIIEEIEQFAWEQLNNENFDKYKAYDEMLTKIKQLKEGK